MSIKHDDKWTAEKQALKKIQMHFVFQEQLNRRIHVDGAQQNINPSDVIRKITGLPYRHIQRPRIGLSFNQQDLAYLAQKYDLQPSDVKQIKQRVRDEVDHYYQQAPEA